MFNVSNLLATLDSFSELPDGWNFGEGKPSAMLPRLQALLMVISGTWLDLDDAEAFPGVDGDIQIDFYKGDEASLEMVFELDGTISVTLDIDDTEPICLARHTSSEKAVKLLQDFAYDTCHSYVCSISSTTTAPKNAVSLASPFVPQVTEAAYLSLKKAAATQKVAGRAYTLKNTTRLQRGHLSYFGKSQAASSQKRSRFVTA